MLYPPEMVLLIALPIVLFALLELWEHRGRRDRRFWRALAALAVSIIASLVSVAIDMAHQKTAGFLVMPAGLLWIAILAATLRAVQKKQRTATRLRLALFVAYSLVGNAYVGAGWIRWLESDLPTTPLAELEPFDAVFVLGGGTKHTDIGTDELSSHGDRVAMCARLYHLGKTKVLVTSGRSIPGLGADRDLTEETVNLWHGMGIPDSVIERIDWPRNTSEEIHAYRELIDSKAWKRVGLVSSAWHLRRALRSARREGLTLIPIPADHMGGIPPIASALFVPQTWGFVTVERAAWETVGMLAGR